MTSMFMGAFSAVVLAGSIASSATALTALDVGYGAHRDLGSMSIAPMQVLDRLPTGALADRIGRITLIRRSAIDTPWASGTAGSVCAVPHMFDPGNWALTVCGFALLAFSTRRRRLPMIYA